MNRFILRMGVEMEGAWKSLNELRMRGVTTHGDGSVNAVYHAPLDDDGNVPYFAADPWTGEVVSPPCAQFRTLEAFIRNNFPAVVNSSCGFHVHFSFVNVGCYSMLMDSEFAAWFRDRMKQWGRENLPGIHWSSEQFYYRLDGRSRYCNREWNPDRQVTRRNKDYARYSLWNFCYGVHGTAECRLFPMFETPDLCVKGAAVLRDLVTEWLEMQHGKPDIEIAEKETIDPMELATERIALPVETVA